MNSQTIDLNISIIVVVFLSVSPPSFLEVGSHFRHCRGKSTRFTFIWLTEYKCIQSIRPITYLWKSQTSIVPHPETWSIFNATKAKSLRLIKSLNNWIYSNIQITDLIFRVASKNCLLKINLIENSNISENIFIFKLWISIAARTISWTKHHFLFASTINRNESLKYI